MGEVRTLVRPVESMLILWMGVVGYREWELVLVGLRRTRGTEEKYSEELIDERGNTFTGIGDETSGHLSHQGVKKKDRKSVV